MDNDFNKIFKNIFDEKKAPEHLDLKIMSYIKRKIYIRNITISVAISFIVILSTIILINPKDINVTKKIENKIEIVREKEEGKIEVVERKKEKIKEEEKENIFYVLFPKDEDIIEETGSIVFYASGGIKEIRYEIDGEIYTKEINEDVIVVPVNLEEGVHILKVHYPYETEILFYSIGEV